MHLAPLSMQQKLPANMWVFALCIIPQLNMARDTEYQVEAYRSIGDSWEERVGWSGDAVASIYTRNET